MNRNETIKLLEEENDKNINISSVENIMKYIKDIDEQIENLNSAKQFLNDKIKSINDAKIINNLSNDLLLTMQLSIGGTLGIPSECLEYGGKYLYKIKYSDIDKRMIKKFGNNNIIETTLIENNKKYKFDIIFNIADNSTQNEIICMHRINL